jgi:quercetin dioxygenase-like cupin family protein
VGDVVIRKLNVEEPTVPWESYAYHLATRFKRLALEDLAPTMQALYVEVEVGGRILPHAQKHAELLFCIEGEGVFSLDEEETELRTGDSLVIRRGGVQGVRNEGETSLRLLVIEATSEGAARGGWLRELLGG